MALMTLREYARYRGVNLSSVQKALKSHRIFVAKEEMRGSKLFKFIDSEEADINWRERTNLDQQRIPTRRQAGKIDGSICSHHYVAPDGEAQSFINDLIPELSKPDIVKKKSDQSSGDVDSYYKDRALREKFAAKTAELDYWEKRSALVPKDALMVKLADLSQNVQKCILNIPLHISPFIVAYARRLIEAQQKSAGQITIVDEKEIQDIISGELKSELRKIADRKF